MPRLAKIHWHSGSLWCKGVKALKKHQRNLQDPGGTADSGSPTVLEVLQKLWGRLPSTQQWGGQQCSCTWHNQTDALDRLLPSPQTSLGLLVGPAGSSADLVRFWQACFPAKCGLGHQSQEGVPNGAAVGWANSSHEKVIYKKKEMEIS